MNTQQSKDEMDIWELNKTVWVRPAQSKIHGIGIIAIRDIPKGMNVREVHTTYFVLDIESAKLLHPEILKIILDRRIMSGLGGRLSFNHPNMDQDLMAFLNHSEEPNTENAYTLRDIKAGEELTEDYRTCAAYPKQINPLSIEHLPFIKF